MITIPTVMVAVVMDGEVNNRKIHFDIMSIPILMYMLL